MKYLLLLYLLFSTVIYGQKAYVFNYLIEYEYQETENSEVQPQYYFTNAQENRVYALLYDDEPGYFKLYFNDAKNGIQVRTNIREENVLKYKQILLDCVNFRRYTPRSIYRSTALKFKINNDTIIDESPYKQYQMRWVHEQNNKIFKFGVHHYIIENNTQFHKPLLSFALDGVSVSSKIIPDGIAREMYFIDPDTKQKKHISKLKRYTKINTQIIIPKNCLRT